MIFTSDRQGAKRLAAQIRGSYSAGPNEHGMFDVFDGDTNAKTAGHVSFATRLGIYREEQD